MFIHYSIKLQCIISFQVSAVYKTHGKLDKEKNQCIRQKTRVQNIVKEIKQYQNKWLKHVQRMDTNRLPKQALQYKQKVATTCTEDGHKQTTKTSTTT